MFQKLDIAVIGGGAAGLCAAVLAARCEKPLRIAVFEKAARTGRKLLVTGSGTCNVSNTAAAPARYHGSGSDAAGFVSPALSAFPSERTVAFFESIGVPCVIRPDGRIYPLTASANTVVDSLRMEMLGRGVQENAGVPVTGLHPEGEGFILYTPQGEFYARRVLVCCGGMASPAQGGCGDGYALLAACGHTRTRLFPSIVPLRTDTALIRAVKGLRTDATVRLLLDGNELARQTQELLFTDYGLSGPAVMYISRAVGEWETRKKGRMTAELDLLPQIDPQALLPMLRARRTLSGRTTDEFLTGLCHKRIGQTVMRACALFSAERPASTLEEDEIGRLARALKNWSVEVLGTVGMGGAQVTAGGMALEEFDPVTLQSRKCPGLYAAGEVLDVDGDCGGFNLQWAWASAHAAVTAMEAGL
ncbi:MAG: aminoacetone oxidase family FAD-binding enzyme [Clostridia bacterium]|nr:aminoacetone oxidase family FAD-binding enzyme [Clostridia bacterium]